MSPPTTALLALFPLKLSPNLLAIVDDALATGRYGSAEEVVAAGLRGLAAGRSGARDEASLAETLRETEERLRLLSDHLPGIMIYQIIADAGGRRAFRYVSAGSEQLFGVAPEAVLEDPSLLYQSIVEDDRARFAAMEAEAVEHRGPFQIEVRIRHTDGGIRRVRLQSAPRALPDGATIWDGFATDVTGQRRSESALRESEARFRHMADSAPALIWMTDAEGEVIFANMHYDHLFGRPAAEMLGRGWLGVILPEDREDFKSAFLEAFEERRNFKAEVRVRNREGRVRWLRCDGVPRLDDAHAFLGYTGCNVDITDVKLAQEQQLLLINELNHRVKNTLATVQSIATQTLRNADTTEQARTDFEARLIALSRAHNVLTRENWEGASLRTIVRQAIEPVPARGRRPLHGGGWPRLAADAHGALHRHGPAGARHQRREIRSPLQQFRPRHDRMDARFRRQRAAASAALERKRRTIRQGARPARVRIATDRAQPGPRPRRRGVARLCGGRPRLHG